MKRETVGVDPKVPIQAVTTVLVFLAAVFGLNVDEQVAGAVAILLGVFTSYFAPAANTQNVDE